MKSLTLAVLLALVFPWAHDHERCRIEKQTPQDSLTGNPRSDPDPWLLEFFNPVASLVRADRLQIRAPMRTGPGFTASRATVLAGYLWECLWVAV